MSTGTAIIERALQKIGAHSIVQPSNPEDIVIGMNALNSMLETWLTQGIDIGVTPLDVPGDELNEPTDTQNGIINNLAIELAPDFDNGKLVVSADLRRNAKTGFQSIKNLYQKVTIPKKVVSSTLPVGAGNSRGINRRVFFPEGGTLGD